MIAPIFLIFQRTLLCIMDSSFSLCTLYFAIFKDLSMFSLKDIRAQLLDLSNHFWTLLFLYYYLHFSASTKTSAAISRIYLTRGMRRSFHQIFHSFLLICYCLNSSFFLTFGSWYQFTRLLLTYISTSWFSISAAPSMNIDIRLLFPWWI